MATTSLQAHRDVLLSRSESWAKGYDRNTGQVFYLFTGSASQTYLACESSCDCKGYEWRRVCAHVLAIRQVAEKARAAAVRRPKTRYEDLHPEADYVF